MPHAKIDPVTLRTVTVHKEQINRHAERFASYTLRCKKTTYHPNFYDIFKNSCPISIIFGTVIAE